MGTGADFGVGRAGASLRDIVRSKQKEGKKGCKVDRESSSSLLRMQRWTGLESSPARKANREREREREVGWKAKKAVGWRSKRKKVDMAASVIN